MAQSGQQPPELHPDELPDWHRGFLGLWQEAAPAAEAAPDDAPAYDAAYAALVADTFEGAEPAEVDEAQEPV